MSIYKTILNDLTTAIKSRDSEKSMVLRSLKASLLEKEISLRTGGERSDLSDEVVTQVLMRAAKQRKDSLQQFEQANREDLAKTERYELGIIETYLPQMMDETEIKDLVQKTAKELGISTQAEMGKLMAALMPKVKGKADGSLVNKIVREFLAG